MTVMELRAYARAKVRVERAKKGDDIPEWDQEQVFAVQAELLRRKRGHQG